MSAPEPGLLSLVPFVSVDNMMRIVWDIGVERMITELAAYIEEDFLRWELFDKTPRIVAHSAEGVIELMPTSDGATYGFKYVNGHPKNVRGGLQTVTAFGVLSHVDSGYPMLISEMTILTALRTAATCPGRDCRVAEEDPSAFRHLPDRRCVSSGRGTQGER